jgi:4-amino-4-deoxy-L-arabinose transferase-like glycosyltransferase
MIVFLAALAVRTAAIAAQFSSLEDDPDGYRRLAVNLRQSGVFGFQAAAGGDVQPSAYRPPLYPMLLSALVHGGELSPAVVAAFHVILGAATAAITLQLGRQSGLGRWAYLAAALVIVDPILLRQSALVMTETLAALLALCGIVALARFANKPSHRRAAAAGAVLGLSVLCRPTFAAWVVLVILAIMVAPSIPHRLRNGAAMLLAVVAVLAPGTLRNLVQLGAPVWSTTHGGYTLWLANNDLFYDHLQRRSGTFDAERLLAPRREVLRAEAGGDEVAFDRRLNREAMEVIRRRPGDFAYATLHRLHDLWRLTPRQRAGSESTLETLARLAVGLWYGAVFLLAILGVFARRRELAASPWLWSLLLCLAFTLVHAAYWTDMRMRTPLMPVIALAAASGAQWARRKNTVNP